MERTALVLLGLSVAACASVPPPHARFGVLPASWRTRDPWPGLDERAALRRGLLARGHVSVIDVATPAEPCEEECARRAASALDVDRVVLTTLASLGDTVLARVSVLDVARGTREETRQRVVRGADRGRITAALVELGRALAEPFAEETPWYERWWPWTIGAALIAGAVAIGTGAVLGSQPGPDVVVTP